MSDENIDSGLVSDMEAQATTIFISVKPSDLKKTTSEELKQFEKDELFDRANQLMSTQKSLLTDPSNIDHSEVEYEEAISEAEKESQDPQDLPDVGEDSIGNGFTGEPIAPDDESEKIVNKAQSIVSDEVVTDEIEDASELFAIADQLLNDTAGSSASMDQLCKNYTTTYTLSAIMTTSLPSPKKEDMTCEIVTQSPSSLNKVIVTESPTTKSTNILPETKETSEVDRPKRGKSTHMWEKFDWGPTGERQKKEANTPTIEATSVSYQLFDTTCELCEDELSDTTAIPSKFSNSDTTKIFKEESGTFTTKSTNLSKIYYNTSEDFTQTIAISSENYNTESNSFTKIFFEESEMYSANFDNLTADPSIKVLNNSKYSSIEAGTATEKTVEASKNSVNESEVLSEKLTYITEYSSANLESFSEMSTELYVKNFSELASKISSQSVETTSLEEVFSDSTVENRTNKLSDISEQLFTKIASVFVPSAMGETSAKDNFIFSESSTESEKTAVNLENNAHLKLKLTYSDLYSLPGTFAKIPTPSLESSHPVITTSEDTDTNIFNKLLASGTLPCELCENEAINITAMSVLPVKTTVFSEIYYTSSSIENLFKKLKSLSSKENESTYRLSQMQEVIKSTIKGSSEESGEDYYYNTEEFEVHTKIDKYAENQTNAESENNYEPLNQANNRISNEKNTINKNQTTWSIEGTRVVEHENGLVIIPKTTKTEEDIRTGQPHFSRVLEEHTIYNDDDEIIGVTNISRLMYKSRKTGKKSKETV